MLLDLLFHINTEQTHGIWPEWNDEKQIKTQKQNVKKKFQKIKIIKNHINHSHQLCHHLVFIERNWNVWKLKRFIWMNHIYIKVFFLDTANVSGSSID